MYGVQTRSDLDQHQSSSAGVSGLLGGLPGMVRPGCPVTRRGGSFPGHAGSLVTTVVLSACAPANGDEFERDRRGLLRASGDQPNENPIA